jgi:hypothetical protein
MTTAHDTRNCRVCGAAFKRSRTDATVNCPDHRGRAARADSRATGGGRTITTCRCGKTVTHVNGTPVRMDGANVTCPRNCG